MLLDFFKLVGFDMLGFEDGWPYMLGAFVAGYLIGALPFGILVARAFGLGDPRAQGSGNIGANNVLRSGNKLAALLTLVLDAAKGFAPTAIAFAALGPFGAGPAGLGAFLGHCFSIYIRFGGGKGVATGFGVLLALNWVAALACAAAWLVVTALTRYASAGALAAAATAPVMFWALKDHFYFVFVVAMMLVVVIRHAGNIRRLARGEERRIALGAGRGP